MCLGKALTGPSRLLTSQSVMKHACAAVYAMQGQYVLPIRFTSLLKSLAGVLA